MSEQAIADHPRIQSTFWMPRQAINDLERERLHHRDEGPGGPIPFQEILEEALTIATRDWPRVRKTPNYKLTYPSKPGEGWHGSNVELRMLALPESLWNEIRERAAQWKMSGGTVVQKALRSTLTLWKKKWKRQQKTVTRPFFPRPSLDKKLVELAQRKNMSCPALILKFCQEGLRREALKERSKQS